MNSKRKQTDFDSDSDSDLEIKLSKSTMRIGYKSLMDFDTTWNLKKHIKNIAFDEYFNNHSDEKKKFLKIYSQLLSVEKGIFKNIKKSFPNRKIILDEFNEDEKNKYNDWRLNVYDPIKDSVQYEINDISFKKRKMKK